MPGENIIEIIDSGDLDILKQYEFDPNERKHHTERTYLHIAIELGYTEIVKYLLGLEDINPNQTADYLDAGILTETTPLHLAIHKDHTDIVKLLIDHSSIVLDASGSNPDGLTPLQYALYQHADDIVEMLIAAGAEKLSLAEAKIYSEFENYELKELFELDVIAATKKELAEVDENGWTLLEKAAEADDVDYVKLLMRSGAVVTKDAYELAGEEVKALLDYRPGRNQQTIYKYCSANNADLKQINRLLLDYADTTDADSSDEENYQAVQTELTEAEKKHLLAQRKQLITDHNQSPTEASQEKLRVVTFRGLHHAPSYFSQAQRKANRADTTPKRTTVSYATLKKSGYEADDEVDEKAKKFVDAHQKVKASFDAMRAKEDAKETKAVTRNKKAFGNLYYRFIQAYVENYNTLFNAGTVKDHFGFDSTDNPAVSTTYLPDKAMKYASGMRNQKEVQKHRLNPHYRRSTGKAKHPHLGFTDVFAMDVQYVKENGAHILELIHTGKIGIGHIKQFECEILFESMIPGQYHIHREIFSLPNFNSEYQAEYEEEYGLSKRMFNSFKKKIIDNPYPRNSNGELEILDELIEQIVVHKGAKLKEKIDAQLFKEDPNKPTYSVYPFRDGEVAIDAVSPNEKDKWRKVEQVVPAEIEEITEDVAKKLNFKSSGPK